MQQLSITLLYLSPTLYEVITLSELFCLLFKAICFHKMLQVPTRTPLSGSRKFSLDKLLQLVLERLNGSLSLNKNSLFKPLMKL